MELLSSYPSNGQAIQVMQNLHLLSMTFGQSLAPRVCCVVSEVGEQR
jgi:hypothetical protein